MILRRFRIIGPALALAAAAGCCAAAGRRSAAAPAPESRMRAAGVATGGARPRRTRRADPALRECAAGAAERTRPHRGAGAAHGLRRLGLLPVRPEPAAAMR